MRSLIYGFVAVAFMVFNTVSVATPFAVSNTFTPGTIAKAADVHANFRALVDDINALARADKLEGFASIAMADLAGTYTTTSLSTQLFKTNAGLSNEFGNFGPISATGTITLYANGTATRSDAIKLNQMKLPTPDVVNATGATILNDTSTWPSNNLTWTLADNIITTSDGESLVIFPGTKTIAGTGYNEAEGKNWIILMVKQ